MEWFTADNHFGHKNIIKYANRPFSSVDNMDRIMIDRWNDIVNVADIVYVLGDFSLNDIKFVFPLIFELNGFIRIIPGGHDWRWIEGYKRYNIEMGKLKILDPLVSLDDKIGEPSGTGVSLLPVVLCHYAMRVWDMSHYGSAHLYGHSHGNLPSVGRSFDVGVDTNDFYPYSLDEILEKVKEIPHEQKTS